MKTLKIRPMGNVSATSRELEQELRSVPVDRADQLIREAAQRIKAEDQEALRILAEHEDDEASHLRTSDAEIPTPHV